MQMKKVLVSACALALLAGCSDASAKLSNGNETVMTVGTQTFTKADVYSMMLNSMGGQEVYTDTMSYISEQEVEITDAMRDEAKQMVDFYKMMYGSQFSQYLTENGMTEEEYLEKVVLPSQRSEALPKTYIEAHFDELVATYDPIQVIVLSFTSEDDAKKALTALKDGSVTPGEAASQNNSNSAGTEEVVTNTSMTYDSAVMSVIRSGTVDDGWVEVPSTDGATFYLVNIVSKTPADFKDEAITALAGITAVTSAATDSFLRKYNFHVYDINVYNSLKELHPEFLIQDNAPVPLPTPAATEAPTPAATEAAETETPAATEAAQ